MLLTRNLDLISVYSWTCLRPMAISFSDNHKEPVNGHFDDCT